MNLFKRKLKGYILCSYCSIIYLIMIPFPPSTGDCYVEVRAYFVDEFGYDFLSIFLQLTFLIYLFFFVQLLLDTLVVRINKPQSVHCYFEFFKSLIFWIILTLVVSFFYSKTIDFEEKFIIWFVLFSFPLLQFLMAPTIYINKDNSITLIHPFALISNFAFEDVMLKYGKIHFYKNGHSKKPIVVLKVKNISFGNKSEFVKKMESILGIVYL